MKFEEGKLHSKRVEIEERKLHSKRVEIEDDQTTLRTSEQDTYNLDLK